MADQDNKGNGTYVVPARLRRLYETIDSSLMEFGSLEPRQKAIMALAKELHVDKAQMKQLVEHARANHPQINAVARVHKLIENAKASGKKPDLSMFRRLQPAAKSAGKDDMWLGAQLGYIPQFIEEAAQQANAKKTSRAVPITLATLLVLAVIGGGVWKFTYGDLMAEQKALEVVDNAAWQEAQELDTAASYNSYLRNHPGGIHADGAKARLAGLDEQAWLDASATNSRKAYERYIGQFGLHSEEALTRMDGLLPGDTFRDCVGCPEMIVVPAGEFEMGSRDGDDTELPVHRVSINQPFAVGIFELTFSEWDLCAVKGSCEEDVYDSGWGRDNRPVVNVSWEDANAYVQWLSQESGETYRLLNEAEWEYSARAGSRGMFWWGNFAGDKAVCEGCENGIFASSTSEAGKYKGNQFGLIDTAGNAAEWVADCWHANYSGAPNDNSTIWQNDRGGDCSKAVVRGGSWLTRPVSLRSAARRGVTRSAKEMDIGFRVAREL